MCLLFNMVPEELVVSEVTLACKYTRHSICLPDMLGLLSLSSRCELSFELWQTTAAATRSEHCFSPRTQMRGQELVVEDEGEGRKVGYLMFAWLQGVIVTDEKEAHGGYQELKQLHQRGVTPVRPHLHRPDHSIMHLHYDSHFRGTATPSDKYN